MRVECGMERINVHNNKGKWMNVNAKCDEDEMNEVMHEDNQEGIRREGYGPLST